MLQKKPIDKNKKPLDKNKNKNKKGNILLKSNFKLIISNDVPLLLSLVSKTDSGRPKSRKFKQLRNKK